MKIGILTFHWATNYGAILQAYCLQEYLKEHGHEVEIINYKPKGTDSVLRNLLKHPTLWKSLNIGKELKKKKKENILRSFRDKYLHTTKRFYTAADLESGLGKYDVLISGSDQVFSPSFTLHGEDGGLCPVYWQGMKTKDMIHIGYSVSFGCETYPNDAAKFAMEWANRFRAIGTREQTGLKILDQLEYEGERCVTPDPTMLLGASLYEKTGVVIPKQREDYTCVYMLRREIQVEGNVRYIDEKHHPLSMEEWLMTIAHASRLITNSYHGTLMAIYAHIPFVVLLETGAGSGMNDRFHTLLSIINAEDRVATNLEECFNVLQRPVNFQTIDNAVIDYRWAGEEFLKRCIN